MPSAVQIPFVTRIARLLWSTSMLLLLTLFAFGATLAGSFASPARADVQAFSEIVHVSLAPSAFVDTDTSVRPTFRYAVLLVHLCVAPNASAPSSQPGGSWTLTESTASAETNKQAGCPLNQSAGSDAKFSGRSVQVVCGSNIWTLAPDGGNSMVSSSRDDISATSLPSHFVRVEDHLASKLAMLQSRRQAGCTCESLSPSAHRAASIAVVFNTTRSRETAAQPWEDIVSSVAAGSCSVQFVGPHQQVQCPLVFPLLARLEDPSDSSLLGDNVSIATHKASLTLCSDIERLASSVSKTEQASSLPSSALRLWDNFYASSVQNLFPGNESQTPPRGHTSPRPSQSLGHMVYTSLATHARSKAHEARSQSAYNFDSGHCVPVPDKRQIAQIHPLQEIRFLELGTRNLLLGGAGGDPSGDSAPSGLGMMLGGDIASGIQFRVEANAGQFTDPNLVAEVTQMVRDRLTSQLSSSVAGPLTDSIVASVTEASVGTIQRFVAQSLATELSGRIVKETDRLIEGGSSHHSFVKGSGAESFQHRIGTRVGTVLAHRLMTSTAALLSQSLSHSIIPALLHTVSHSPLQDYYCYYCAKHKTYCSYCQYAPAQLYYAVYYGEYYSHYYTNFYVRYYTQLMQP